jgi:hypothetical protein
MGATHLAHVNSLEELLMGWEEIMGFRKWEKGKSRNRNRERREAWILGLWLGLRNARHFLTPKPPTAPRCSSSHGRSQHHVHGDTFITKMYWGPRWNAASAIRRQTNETQAAQQVGQAPRPVVSHAFSARIWRKGGAAVASAAYISSP